MLSSAQFNGTKTFSPYPSGYRAATVKLSNPKFSGFSDGAASIFGPVTEQYIFGFFAQDVVALWIPRIINALRRGRNEYNPNEDPNLRKGHPLQQKLHALYMNIKGLNYPNCREETFREVETGPGLIIVQSAIAFGLAAKLGTKWALMMGHHQLKGYAEALKQTINNLPEMLRAEIGSSKDPSKVVTQFIKDHLINEPGETSWHFDGNVDLLKKPIDLSGLIDSLATKKPVWYKKLLHQLSPKRFKLPENKSYQEILTQFVKRPDVYGPNADLSQITYRQLLEKWAELWPQGVRFSKQSEELEEVFKTLIKVFNLKVLNQGPVEDLPLATLGHALRQVKKNEAEKWVADNLKPELAIKDAEGFLENLRKFTGFVSEAVEKSFAKYGDQGWVEGLTNNGIIEKLTHTLLATKFLYGVAATLAAGFLVVWVSAMAQSGRAYPANRNLKLGEADAEEGITSSEGSGNDTNSQNQAMNALLQGMQNYAMAPMPADMSQQQPSGYNGYGQYPQPMGYPAQGYAANMSNPFGNAYAGMMSGYAQPTGQYTAPTGGYTNYGFNSPQYPGGYGQ